MKKHSLREVRESRRRSQVEVAAAMGVSQSAVSKIERRGDVSVSALASFVSALGGRLDIAAQFPDARVPLDLAREALPVVYGRSAPVRKVAERESFVMPEDWAAEVLRIRSLPPEARMEEVANFTEFFAEATRRA